LISSFKVHIGKSLPNTTVAKIQQLLRHSSCWNTAVAETQQLLRHSSC